MFICINKLEHQNNKVRSTDIQEGPISEWKASGKVKGILKVIPINNNKWWKCYLYVCIIYIYTLSHI